MKNYTYDSPFQLKVSFNKLLGMYDELAKSEDEAVADKAKKILAVADQYPELRAGFSDIEKINDYKEPINTILGDIFNPVLSNNEIKTAGLAYDDAVFKSSERFKKIIKDAGKDFSLELRNIPENEMYIIQCAAILSLNYKKDLSFKMPLFYDIPDSEGINRHYRILYNADFMELKPTKDAPTITQEDIDQLLDGFDNLDLWKEKFPPNSWEANGFIISNIFDVTIDDSISSLKTALLEQSLSDGVLLDRFQDIFRSIFGIKDLHTGYSSYDENTLSFEKLTTSMPSYLLNENAEENCMDVLCENSYKAILDDKKYFTISDVEKYYDLSEGAMPYRALHNQGFKSAILIPIANDKQLLGVLELVSERKHDLNSINANKLNEVMPYIISAVVRNKIEHINSIEAIIQNEYTSLHESVKWKFVNEAKKYIKEKSKGNNPSFSDISFKNVYPLYGQIDIKDSSRARNDATQKDLIIQLEMINNIFNSATKIGKMPIYEEYSFRINSFLKEVKETFQTSSEQNIIDFLFEEIHPALKQVSNINPDLKKLVEEYENALNTGTNMIYHHRREYDDTIMLINKKMSKIIDHEQKDAQKMFPHFFERYKTDGVEHTMYIGKSINPSNNFSEVFLQNLKLWQLEVMCEMENEYYDLRPNLEISLDVASLILVHSSPLSIKFRMDEKHFDVDGTYNARYEVIKKRIDKAFIKGTNERVTKPGNITIIYSQKKDENEYLRYVRLLQAKKVLHNDLEILDLEELQGVSGLKAIRVGVLYKNENNKSPLTFDDLAKVIAK
ncbi:GAF domain-containing protein [Joostella atrarenae]|uniref:GAF domain-containing protein n=1 Tax=Joostella atrarenae TaxID=679257 RepID=A0ABS9IYM6_9FLAO|nr:GAF domain-containing protein [Joostella atrarenae]MCF8713286.1 GAF domain-containing protein [Joostella atrarenae]